MLQQAQNKENDHIVITINDDDNEWKMERKANSESSKTTKIIKGAIISFVVGVALLATSLYSTVNDTSQSDQTRQLLSGIFAKFPTKPTLNLYTVLRATKGDSEPEIKRKYFQLSRQHHGDRPGGSDEEMKKITWAKEQLLDVANRKKWNNELRQQMRGKKEKKRKEKEEKREKKKQRKRRQKRKKKEKQKKREKQKEEREQEKEQMERR